MKHKQCTKCNKILPITSFSLRKSRSKIKTPRKIPYSICKICLNKQVKKKIANNPIIYILHQIKSNAKRKGLEFNLTSEDIVIPVYCPVLGIKLEICSCTNRMLCRFLHENNPSVDRIDSSKGYIRGNIKIISWHANRLKGDGTIEDHERIAKYMEEYL